MTAQHAVRPHDCTTAVKGLRVLVVEDEPDVAASAARILALSGFERVTVAGTAEAALELSADDPPDAVLLDLRLPDLDGCDVARWLREQVRGAGKRPLLIAVTGCDTAADRQRSAAAGVDLHLVKPVDPAVLVGLLRRFARLFASDGAGTAETWHDLPEPAVPCGRHVPDRPRWTCSSPP